ncbi:WD40-repeat-containing domain protein [Gongronella butleri]|nr:WD40-repeat-containing domain protein [Gongronella butleri]
MVGTPFQPNTPGLNSQYGLLMNNLLVPGNINTSQPAASATTAAAGPAYEASPPAQGAPSAQDLQQLVNTYFERKGYKKQDLAYLRDASGNTVSMEQLLVYLKTKLANRPASANPLLHHIASTERPQDLLDPNAHQEHYAQFRDWVHRGLDEYKDELRLLLYPMLVHCYLDLMAANLPNHGHALLERYASDHEDHEQHASELAQFMQMTTAQQMQNDELAQKYRNNKYHVSMTAIPRELFVNYIQDIQWAPIVRIVSQYLSIQVLHDKSAGGSEANGIGILENGVAARLKQEDDDDEMMVDGQDTLRIVKQESALEEPSLSDMSMSPMDKERVEASLEALKEMRKRVAVGSASLPSVCAYTFYNTHDSLNCLSFSQDASLLAGGFEDSTVKVWSMNGEPLQTKNGADYARLVGHAGPVYAASFSPDNSYMITCSQDHTARLWNVNSWSNQVVYKSHNYPVWDVDVGPFGFYFATASHDRTARLWSCDHIYPLRIFAGHLSDVDVVKFHPNSKYLVTGSSDKTARLWDVQRGTCVRVFTGHSGAIKTVAISPNGRLMASTGEDRTIQLWDLGSGRCLKTMVGHHDYVYSLDFSSDSHVLVSGSADCTVRVWDVNKDTSGGAIASSSGASKSKSSDNASTSAQRNDNKRIRMEDAQRKDKKDKKFDSRANIIESRDQLAVLPTKQMPVYTVKYNQQRNVCTVAGAYSP